MRLFFTRNILTLASLPSDPSIALHFMISLPAPLLPSPMLSRRPVWRTKTCQSISLLVSEALMRTLGWSSERNKKIMPANWRTSVSSTHNSKACSCNLSSQNPKAGKVKVCVYSSVVPIFYVQQHFLSSKFQHFCCCYQCHLCFPCQTQPQHSHPFLIFRAGLYQVPLSHLNCCLRQHRYGVSCHSQAYTHLPPLQPSMWML